MQGPLFVDPAKLPLPLESNSVRTRSLPPNKDPKYVYGTNARLAT
jgi:hypothetical protein